MDPNSDPGMSPIRIGDVFQLLNKSISQNERPYTKSAIEYNNKIVNGFYKDILLNISTKTGTVKAGQVWGEWNYYNTGKHIPNYVKCVENGYINRPSSDIVNHWVNLFSKTDTEKLVEMGPATIGHGWKIVKDEIEIRRKLSKWENIYKDHDDPMKWRELCHDKPKEWTIDEDYIFWSMEKYEEVEERVKAVLKFPKIPIKTPTVKKDDIRKSVIIKTGDNAPALTKISVDSYNKSTEHWLDIVYPEMSNKIEGDEIDSNEILAEIGIFKEGDIVKSFIDTIEKGISCRPSKKSVEYWKNVFEKSSVEELMKLGNDTVKSGWKIIADESYIRTVVYKWDNIYKGTRDPLVWRERIKFIEDNKVKPETIWDDEKFSDIGMKVLTVIKTVVNVE